MSISMNPVLFGFDFDMLEEVTEVSSFEAAQKFLEEEQTPYPLKIIAGGHSEDQCTSFHIWSYGYITVTSHDLEGTTTIYKVRE